MKICSFLCLIKIVRLKEGYIAMRTYPTRAFQFIIVRLKERGITGRNPLLCLISIHYCAIERQTLFLPVVAIKNFNSLLRD